MPALHPETTAQIVTANRSSAGTESPARDPDDFPAPLSTAEGFTDGAASMRSIRLNRELERMSAGPTIAPPPPVVTTSEHLPVGGKGALVVVPSPGTARPKARPWPRIVVRGALVAAATLSILLGAGHLLLSSVERQRPRPVSVMVIAGADSRATSRAADDARAEPSSGDRAVDAAGLPPSSAPAIAAAPLPAAATELGDDGASLVLRIEEPGGGAPASPLESDPDGGDGSARRQGVDEDSTAIPALPTGGYAVQLASLASAREAQRESRALRRRHAGLLRGLALSVETATVAARGRVYRIRVGGFATVDAAQRLCARLARRDADCLVIRRRLPTPPASGRR